MKTILIVDDMAIFREPVAATLRQEGFQTQTAANGEEALRMVRLDPPDLILLDAAMPVMDGLTFCQHMRGDDSLRNIPIIMLTAITDRNVVQKAVQSGVQDYLLKTQFSTEELLNRINRLLERTSAAHVPAVGAAASVVASDSKSEAIHPGKGSEVEPISADRVIACVREHMEIRSIKPVLQHVLALTRSSASSFDEIDGAIRKDQALAMKVMKVANSSFYRTGKLATTLREAEQRIGLAGIRNATTAILAMEQFSEANPAGIIPQRFWEHAMATAMLAERIGELVDAPHPEDLFLAGLLHDLGRLVLSDALPEHYARIIEDFQTSNLSLHDLEREHLQLTHADVTREVLVHWRMPAHIIEAASLHHLHIAGMSQDKRYPRAALCVALANRMSHALLLGDSGSEMIEPLEDAAQSVGLDPRALNRLADEAVTKTADTTLFYAMHSDTRTLDPLAATLHGDPRTAPRVVAPANPAPTLQPVLLMLGQLGWLQSERPNVALIGGESEAQMRQQMRAANIPLGQGRPLPVVWISCAESACGEPADQKICHVTLPCRYTRIVETVSHAARPEALARI